MLVSNGEEGNVGPFGLGEPLRIDFTPVAQPKEGSDLSLGLREQRACFHRWA